MQQSHILEQTLREHLRADVDPSAHHAPTRGVDLKRERVEHNLRKVVVVAITINELLQVVEDLEFAQQLIDALVGAGQDSKP